ncbi:MAG: ketoreductase [Phycisphaerae bacterium]|nr:ketoreductase [Phycisphaerae bacterium]
MDTAAPRTMIVSGGGSGIGQAIVQLLAARGDHVVICGRRESALLETARSCEAQPGKVVTVVADLAMAGEEDRVVDAAMSIEGRIDAVINNAGRTWPVSFPEWDEDELDHVLQVNLRGPVRLVKAAWSSLVKARGCVVNLSSLAVLMPFPGNGAYGVSKSALDGFTRAIHVEASESGVRAFSIAPGAVETEMLRTIVDESMLPQNKTMHPDEIAGLVLECLDGHRDAHAGQTLLAAIPGLVTCDPQEAHEALARFHAPDGV